MLLDHPTWGQTRLGTPQAYREGGYEPMTTYGGPDLREVGQLFPPNRPTTYTDLVPGHLSAGHLNKLSGGITTSLTLTLTLTPTEP